MLLFHGSKHGACHLKLSMEMDVDKTEYLPNLPNDKTGEELLFEEKVFHNNEVFRRIHQDIINRHLSDENNCCKNCKEQQECLQNKMLKLHI